MKFKTLRPNSDLLAACLLAIITVLVTLLGVENTLLRVLLGVPLVLFFPGYAITAVVFPARGSSPFERALYSLGLSIAVAVMGGVVLNSTPWGLQASTWSLLLAGVTISASAIAWTRRSGSAASRPQARLAFRWDQALLFGLAAGVLVMTLALSQIPAPAQGTEGYTLLWIQPNQDSSRDSVRIGIQSMELAETTYRLQLQVDGKVVREWESIEIPPGETREYRAGLSVPLDAAAVQAVLYRADSPNSAYRYVSLTP